MNPEILGASSDGELATDRDVIDSWLSTEDLRLLRSALRGPESSWRMVECRQIFHLAIVILALCSATHEADHAFRICCINVQVYSAYLLSHFIESYKFNIIFSRWTIRPEDEMS